MKRELVEGLLRCHSSRPDVGRKVIRHHEGTLMVWVLSNVLFDLLSSELSVGALFPPEGN